MPDGINQTSDKVFNFGTVLTTDTNPSFTYTITGTDLDDAIPLTLALNNTTGSAFSITPTADFSPVGGMLPDGTTITVTFNPTAEQEYTATITHAGAGLANNVVLTITGEGVAPTGPPEPAITITPNLP